MVQKSMTITMVTSTASQGAGASRIPPPSSQEYDRSDDGADHHREQGEVRQDHGPHGANVSLRRAALQPRAAQRSQGSCRVTWGVGVGPEGGCAYSTGFSVASGIDGHL